MSDRLRIALCQLNATVGDVLGNEAKIVAGIEAARARGAQLVLLPELALTGYPPEDLLLKEHFLRDARAALLRVAAHVRGIVAIVGYPEHAEDVFNSAAILAEGAIRATYRKLYLPNYGVFDEQRYFQAGPGPAVLDIGDVRVGLTICEDIWEPGPPAADEARAGASLIVNISASPYHAGKGLEREEMLAQRARENRTALAFCALVGGQDELVFDGHSCVFDHAGELIGRAAQFDEELLVCEIDPAAGAATRLRSPAHRQAARRQRPEVIELPSLELPQVSAGSPPAPRVAELLTPLEAEIYAALELGLRDYVEKNGFRHVVLGLSGGIDSALVACIATDALGSERVSVAVMPSPHSSSDTQEDARALAGRLGVGVLDFEIAQVMDAYRETLSSTFDGHPPDITEENLQARIRGNLLMAVSNKFGWLVLTTGNKSEISVGYTTLYGDMAGGFAVIKDVPKTLVYALVQWRNSPQAAARALAGARPPAPSPVPESIIARAPTAELRPDQRDEDSLPPYALLDRILEGYVELDAGRERLLARGLPAAEVDRAIGLVDRAEYKRRQAPPGIKISTRAFGRDRRMPITNRYRG